MYKISNVSYRYPDQKDFALTNINLDFGEGEFVILCGRNGGGKSTLLKALLGIIPKSIGGDFNGTVEFEQSDIATLRVVELSGKVGVLLQDPHAQITNLTCFEEVAFGLENLRFSRNSIPREVDKYLNIVKLCGFANKMTFELSGGQSQRLSLGSLFAMRPSVLTMDEPLANLDLQGTEMVIETLRSLRSRTRLTIVSSHIIEPFIQLATRVVVLDGGKVVLDFPIGKLESYRDELTNRAVFISNPNYETKKVSMVTNKQIINMRDLGFIYPGGQEALIGVTCSINDFDRVLITGPNGGGKSTLAKIVTGLKKPSAGSFKSYTKKAWYLHQNPVVGFLKPTVLEEISYGQTMSQNDVYKIALYFGLDRYLSQSPFTLSGGQQKLVAMASAFAAEPDLLVLDEPTGGLDAEFTQKILDASENFEGTILHISHDLRVTSLNLSRTFRIESGHLKEEVKNVTNI